MERVILCVHGADTLDCTILGGYSYIWTHLLLRIEELRLSGGVLGLDREEERGQSGTLVDYAPPMIVR
jgi:hypothetical protein